ncbi:MAG: AI-2E family transporter [Kiritimatiellaeota bacterium]|nr:AI-2E family transporter [Kiritimatiellota bacterium]
MKTEETDTAGNKGASFFSPRQQRIVAAGFTAFCAALVIAFAVALLWAVGRLLAVVSGVLTPLLVAIILTVIFKPFYRWLYNHLWRVHALALVAFLISLLIPVVLVFGVFGALLVSQVSALVSYLPTLAEDVGGAMPNLSAFLDQFGLAAYLSAEHWRGVIQANLVAGGVGSVALAYGLGGVKYLISLVGWLILPVYLIYFLISEPFTGGSVTGCVPFLSADLREDIAYLIDEFLRIISAFFRGQVVISLVQGVLYGFGFWAVGLPYGLLIGFCLGCLNLIPYLGSIIGLSIALPMAYFGDGGSLTRMLLVLAVFTAVLVLDYWLTPKIMKTQTGLSNVAVIFSLFFWGAVFGSIMGVLLAIPLSAFVVVFWRLLTTKYIPRWI